MRRHAPSMGRRGHEETTETLGRIDTASVLKLVGGCQSTKSMSLLAILVFLVVLTPASPVHALYQWQGEQSDLELHGLIRLFGSVVVHPDDAFVEDKSEIGAGQIARLIMQAHRGEQLGFELNIFQAFIPEALLSQGNVAAFLDVERSSALSWNLKDGVYAPLEIDRLNVRLTYNRLDLILGRQPISLATTYYFTPNDFFAPFAAQSFYRVFKSGVDAARVEVRLGELSQLSLINVLGYERDPSSDTGWSENPDRDRTSYVARASAVVQDFEWALLGGTVRQEYVFGGSVQGELFGWLGIRGEGHSADPDDPAVPPSTEMTLGFEHKWPSSLHVRLEQFYHGSGAESVSEYTLTPAQDQRGTAYLARHYTALGAGYELTPLWTGEFLALFNWIDYSTLLTGNAVYSLSDESEISFIIGIPIGKEPEGLEIRSEFGTYPYYLNVEVRSFF